MEAERETNIWKLPLPGRGHRRRRRERQTDRTWTVSLPGGASHGRRHGSGEVQTAVLAIRLAAAVTHEQKLELAERLL